MALLTPVIGLFLMCVVVVGRTQVARGDIEGAARSAARDLSMERNPQEALERVRRSAAAMVDVGSPGCRDFRFDAVVANQSVIVTIACVADLQDAALLPVPGSLTLSGTATEPIDQYREDE